MDTRYPRRLLTLRQVTRPILFMTDPQLTVDGPEDLTGETTAQIGLYTHRGQDSRTSCNRPGP